METMKFDEKTIRGKREVLIPQILTEVNTTRQAAIDLYGRYKGNKGSIPVYSRRLQIENEEEWKNLINCPVNNDFFSLIVDDFTGFLTGNPVSYYLDDEHYEKEDVCEEHNKLLQNWLREVSMIDEDTELVKSVGICGSAYRLQYYDKDKTDKVKFLMLMDFEVVIVHTGNPLEPIAALRLFDDGTGIVNRVDWYDEELCEIWKRVSGKDQVKWIKMDKYKHTLGAIPVTEYINNKERLGDCVRSIPLIDAYNILTTDVLSELQQFRMAYMALMGGSIEEGKEDAFIKKLVGIGVVEVPEGGDVRFITKNIDATVNKMMMDKLEENIYRFSKATNYASEKIGGGSTAGVTLQQRTIPTKNACNMKKNKKNRGDRRFFEILFNYWKRKKIADIPLAALRIQYTPNYPVNLLEEAQVQTQLDGRIPTRDRLSLFSGVTDPVDTEARLFEERGTVFGDPWTDQEKKTTETVTE